MATYIYETIPQQEGEAPRRFEVVQSMKDAPLRRHPDTGEAVRRIISGGYGLMSKQPTASFPPKNTAVSCAPGCACHSGPRVPAT